MKILLLYFPSLVPGLLRWIWLWPNCSGGSRCPETSINLPKVAKSRFWVSSSKMHVETKTKHVALEIKFFSLTCISVEASLPQTGAAVYHFTLFLSWNLSQLLLSPKLIFLFIVSFPLECMLWEGGLYLFNDVSPSLASRRLLRINKSHHSVIAKITRLVPNYLLLHVQ